MFCSFVPSLLMFSPDRRLQAQIHLNCFLSTWVSFPLREFSCSSCLVAKVVTQGEWLFHCNANRGAAGDFSHFVLPCLGCGTYGRSCRKDSSQWIEVMQARASGTAGHKCRWHREKLYAGAPVELFWREQCNARKYFFCPAKNHFRTTARQTEIISPHDR